MPDVDTLASWALIGVSVFVAWVLLGIVLAMLWCWHRDRWDK